VTVVGHTSPKVTGLSPLLTPSLSPTVKVAVGTHTAEPLSKLAQSLFTSTTKHGTINIDQTNNHEQHNQLRNCHHCSTR